MPTAGAGLPSGWAHPEGLAGQALRQLDRCRTLLDGAVTQALAATIAEAPGRFAHGDFCPVNVLVERPTTNDQR